MTDRWRAFMEKCIEDFIAEDDCHFEVSHSWLDRWETKQMRDPEFVAAIEELEPEYQKIRESMDCKNCKYEGGFGCCDATELCNKWEKRPYLYAPLPVDWSKEMSDECCETKPPSLICLANDLRETQEKTDSALEVICGPSPIPEDRVGEKPHGNLDELRILLIEMLGNAKSILDRVARISNAI